MEKNQILVTVTNDKLWNIQELVSFLVENQRKHIVLKINPEAVPLSEVGVYQLLDNFDFLQVDIVTSNPFEQHDKYNIIHRHSNIFVKQIIDVPPKLHCWDGSKIFLNLYGRPTASRLGIASYLLSQYPNDSCIHFSYKPADDNLPHFELEKLLGYDINSVGRAARLISRMPIELASSQGYTNKDYIYTDQLTNLYSHIFVDIVGENHVSGTTFFPTEKIWRPMWMKKPFIVFGSRDYLCYLEQMGFKTFQTLDDRFWSEDYDGYEGKERYIRILALIDKLAKKSKDELQEMYQLMQPILDHNYNLLVTQSYTNAVTEIIE